MPSWQVQLKDHADKLATVFATLEQTTNGHRAAMKVEGNFGWCGGGEMGMGAGLSSGAKPFSGLKLWQRAAEPVTAYCRSYQVVEAVGIAGYSVLLEVRSNRRQELATNEVRLHEDPRPGQNNQSIKFHSRDVRTQYGAAECIQQLLWLSRGTRVLTPIIRLYSRHKIQMQFAATQDQNSFQQQML